MSIQNDSTGTRVPAQVVPFGSAFRPQLRDLVKLSQSVKSSATWLHSDLDPIYTSKINFERADEFMLELEERFNKLRASYSAYRQRAGGEA